MPAESPAVIIFDQDGNPVDVIQDVDGYYRIAVDSRISSNPFSLDRDKVVIVNIGREGETDTVYYDLIDLDGPDYKHTPGSAAKVIGIAGKGLKTNSGSQWAIQLAVILRIDGTDADLGILPGGSISLRDTSIFGASESFIIFPAFLDLEVSGGDFVKIANGFQELGVTDINTGTTIEDALGNNVTPAVGDVLLRVNRIQGAGTLSFAYGVQYWVE